MGVDVTLDELEGATMSEGDEAEEGEDLHNEDDEEKVGQDWEEEENSRK